MTSGTIEEHLVTLETRMDTLQHQIEANLTPTVPTPKRGWKAIVGTFAHDPLYEEAMRLGREWRENNTMKPTGRRPECPSSIPPSSPGTLATSRRLQV